MIIFFVLLSHGKRGDFHHRRPSYVRCESQSYSRKAIDSFMEGIRGKRVTGFGRAETLTDAALNEII